MNKLPNSLLIQIFKKLSSNEWSKLSLVCKKWRKNIFNSIGISVYLLEPPCFYPKHTRWPSLSQSMIQYTPLWKCIVGETDSRVYPCYLKNPELLRVIKLNGRIPRVCFVSIFHSLINLDFLSIDICTFYHLKREDLIHINLSLLRRLRVTSESVRKGNPFNDIRVEGQVLGLLTLLHNKFPSLESLSVNYPHYIGMNNMNKRIFQGLVKSFEINRATLRRVWISNQDVSIKMLHDHHYAHTTWDKYSPIFQKDGRTLPMEKLEEFYIDLDSVEDSITWRIFINKQLHFTRLSDSYLHVGDSDGQQNKRWPTIPYCLKTNPLSITQLNLTDLLDFLQINQKPSRWDLGLSVALGIKKPSKKTEMFQIMSDLLLLHHPQRHYQKRQTSRLLKKRQFLDFGFFKDLSNLKKLSLDGGSLILEPNCLGSLVICGIEKLPMKTLGSIEIRNLYVDRYDVKVLLSHAKFPNLSHLKLVNIGEYEDFGIDAFDFIQLIRNESKFLKEVVINDGINWESWNLYQDSLLKQRSNFDEKRQEESGENDENEFQQEVEENLDILQRVLKSQNKQIALRLIEKNKKLIYIDFDLTKSYLKNKLPIMRPQEKSIHEFYESSNRKFGMN